jgi:hypothetical protein
LAGTLFQLLGCRLVNIAAGGAAVLTPEPPGVGEPIWVRLVADPIPTEAARGVVLGVTAVGPDEYLARIRFDDPCPPGLWQAAVEGPERYRVLDQLSAGTAIRPRPSPRRLA